MKDMTNRATCSLARAVRCAAALVAFALAGGCAREAEKPAEPVPARDDPPSVYMKDPVFRKSLEKQREARNNLAAVRNRLEAEMIAKVDAAKARLGTGDEATVKAELEKDPEWRSLHSRITDVNTAIDDNRRKTASIVKDRVAPGGAPAGKKEISK